MVLAVYTPPSKKNATQGEQVAQSPPFRPSLDCWRKQKSPRSGSKSGIAARALFPGIEAGVHPGVTLYTKGTLIPPAVLGEGEQDGRVSIFTHFFSHLPL